MFDKTFLAGGYGELHRRDSVFTTNTGAAKEVGFGVGLSRSTLCRKASFGRKRFSRAVAKQRVWTDCNTLRENLCWGFSVNTVSTVVRFRKKHHHREHSLPQRNATQ